MSDVSTNSPLMMHSPHKSWHMALPNVTAHEQFLIINNLRRRPALWKTTLRLHHRLWSVSHGVMWRRRSVIWNFGSRADIKTQTSQSCICAFCKSLWAVLRANTFAFLGGFMVRLHKFSSFLPHQNTRTLSLTEAIWKEDTEFYFCPFTTQHFFFPLLRMSTLHW